jgi:hypothetical protein
MSDKNYRPGQKISRAEAWHDLKGDVVRFLHTFTDVFVNLARIAGISERDKSQKVGRVVAVLVALLLIGSSVGGVASLWPG